MNLRFWTKTFWSDIGYGLSSSPFLVRRILSIASIPQARVILELGAGEGQVTAGILSKKSNDTRLIVIENDHEKFIELSRKYGHLCDIHEMSAAHIDTIIDPESIDIVISTLPLGSLSREGVDHILSVAQSVLKKGGTFVQYQYALQNKKQVEKYFTMDRIFFELLNFWPAFIYRAHKK